MEGGGDADIYALTRSESPKLRRLREDVERSMRGVLRIATKTATSAGTSLVFEAGRTISASVCR